jgi:hypothetical protein
MAGRQTRRSFALNLGMLLGLGRPAGAGKALAGDVIVEDWRTQPVGARGIPTGWEPYRTPGGQPQYDFTVVDVDGRRALHLESRGDRSTIARAVAVDLEGTPVLQWHWKMVQLPAGADVRRAHSSDSGPHVIVVWRRPPELIRSRVLAYVWDPILPPNTIQRSRKAPTVTFVVVRSGAGGLTQWLTERRDVRADYRRVYDEEPDAPRAIALSIDTNDTRAPSAGFVGPIAFRGS